MPFYFIFFLQHTFADSITQLLLLKPNKFWERHRAGMGMSFHRSRYTFSIVLLETCRELLHYLGASQLPVELEGSLIYNHDEWMSAQEVNKNNNSVFCNISYRVETNTKFSAQIVWTVEQVNIQTVWMSHFTITKVLDLS